MPEPTPPRYERTDLSPAGLTIFAGVLVMALLIIALFVWIFIRTLHGESLSRTAIAHPTAPAPRLQASPAADLQRMQAENQQRLQSYGWVDRPAGVVHLPIERAMELTVQRGLPARSQPASPQP